MYGNPEETISLHLDLGQSAAKADELAKSLQTLAVATDQAATPAVKQAGEAAAATAVKMEQMAQAGRDVAQAKDAATRATGDFGRGLLNVSFAVQDFTSQLGTRGLLGGLGAIQNNIPVILAGLGLGPGLAGVASIAAVGVGALGGALSGVSQQAKDAAKAIEDTARAAERLRDASGPEAKKQAGDVEGFLAGQGQVVGQGIEAALTSRARAQGLAAERQQMQQFGVITETAEQFVERNRPAIRADADRFLTGLGKDRSARQFVAELARERPGNFPRGFAEDIMSFDRDTGDADLEAAEAFGQRAHRGMASRRAAEARRRQGLAAEVSTRQFGAAMDYEELAAERAYYGAAPAVPPPFYDRRLPVGRIDAGPMPAAMTPAQQRALVQQQAGENAQRLQNQTFDQVVGTMNQTVHTNQAMLTVMGKAQAALIEARQKLRQQEQQANGLLSRGRQ